MYTLRFTDVLIGTVTIQFNKKSTDNVYCICSRVVIKTENKKNQNIYIYDGNELPQLEEPPSYWRESTSQDYKFDPAQSTFLYDRGDASNTQVSTAHSEQIQQEDSTIHISDSESKSCCCIFGLRRMFRSLRKRLRKRKNKRKELENNASECLIQEAENSENAIKYEKYPDLVIERGKKHISGSSQNNDVPATVENTSSEENYIQSDPMCTDPVKSGLLGMGYMFDACKSDEKILYQRVALNYDEVRLNRFNKGLILQSVAKESKPQTSKKHERDTNDDNEECNDVPQQNKRKKPNNHVNAAKFQIPQEIQNDPSLRKYWNNRYRLFSRFDRGIKLDAESWYSVTPEKVSKHLADRCCCDVIVDGFCGAGGNTIQFAFKCERVIAIDIDPKKIEMAKHNAEIYNVADRIEFIVGNFFDVAPLLKADVVFLSPPWGGPSYNKQKSFPLEKIVEPYGGKYLFETARKISEHIAYYLPRNVNVDEIMKLGGPGSKVEIEQNILGYKLVAVTAYFGELLLEYEDYETY